VVGVEPATS